MWESGEDALGYEYGPFAVVTQDNGDIEYGAYQGFPVSGAQYEFCYGFPNSTGEHSFLTITGDADDTVSPRILRVDSLPGNRFGIFFASREVANPGFVPPGSSGRLCLRGALGRFPDSRELRLHRERLSDPRPDGHPPARRSRGGDARRHLVLPVLAPGHDIRRGHLELLERDRDPLPLKRDGQPTSGRPWGALGALELRGRRRFDSALDRAPVGSSPARPQRAGPSPSCASRATNASINSEVKASFGASSRAASAAARPSSTSERTSPSPPPIARKAAAWR